MRSMKGTVSRPPGTDVPNMSRALVAGEVHGDGLLACLETLWASPACWTLKSFPTKDHYACRRDGGCTPTLNFVAPVNYEVTKIHQRQGRFLGHNRAVRRIGSPR